MLDSPATDRAARIFQSLTSERLFLAILGIALSLPLLLSRLQGDRLSVCLPLITSGDEPHYLAMIHSLVDDGDLDLRNNYDAARAGSIDVGVARAGAPINHQVAWYSADGSYKQWHEVFEYHEDPRQPDGLRAQPSLKPGVSTEFESRPQFSTHPPGLPLLLAPLVYPFRGTAGVEHAAVVMTMLATFVMALFLRDLFRTASPNAGVVNAATLLAVLASPTWHYGRMLFCEPWLTLCAVAAVMLAVRRHAYFFAGCFVAVGVQMKPPFALLALPFFVDRLLSRDLKRAFLFSLPVMASVALVLAENQYFFGSPLRSAQPWANGNLLLGLLGVLFSWNHGLFLFAPAVLIAALGWPSVFRAQQRLAWLIVALSLPYVLLMSLWQIWWGGYCYGPRLVAPIIPFLFLGIVPIFARYSGQSLRFRRVAKWTILLSLGISALGGVLHMAFWSQHPLITPVLLLVRRI